jgi:hypothetical protein
MAKGDNMIDGKICSHAPTIFKLTKLTAYEILQCLYVDDGAFLFNTSGDLLRGMELIYHHFGRFGLEMHIGQGEHRRPKLNASSFLPTVIGHGIGGKHIPAKMARLAESQLLE